VFSSHFVNITVSFCLNVMKLFSNEQNIAIIIRKFRCGCLNLLTDRACREASKVSRITPGDQVLKQLGSLNLGSTSGGAAELQQLPEAMSKQQRPEF
jgi:hypothetical protein